MLAESTANDGSESIVLPNVDKLTALQNEVHAQTGASLSAEEAAELTQRIGWIRTALGC